MKYVIYKKIPNRNCQPSIIKSWNEKVVEATPAFKWAIGKNIGTVLEWLNSRGWTVEIKGD